MERFVRLIVIVLFCTVTLLSNAWAIALGTVLLLQVLYYFFPRYNYILLLPIYCTLVAHTGSSFVWTCLSLLAIYIIRILEKDNIFNHSKIWMVCLVFSFVVYWYMPYLLATPLILLVITLPVPTVVRKAENNNNVGVYWLAFILFSIIFCLYGLNQEKHRAYLHKGIWAQARTKYEITNLKNASCYSYTEFVDIIGADTISSISNIEAYNELWVITPTTPFTRNELAKIKKWVAHGGNLIVVSDHTDLYGHARCVNQIANEFGCDVNYSATFDKHDKQVFKNAWMQPLDIKTGTNIKGMLFPALSAWLWEEDAYYGEDNFFGPLAISGDDIFGNKVLLGQMSYGLGQVGFLQDSTIFSNFAVYQPYVLDLVKILSSHSLLSRLMFLIPFLIVLSVVVLYYGKRRNLAIIALYAPLCIPICDAGELYFGENPQIWTGNSEFIRENGCAYTNISTAYSLAPLSNRKPLWKENVDPNCNDVIWVDSVPPPNHNWRWVKVEDIHMTRKISDSPWEDFYKLMDAPYMEYWDKISDNYNVIKMNSLFADKVMNDWWYNDGITRNRQARINAWINWLNKSKAVNNPVKYDKTLFSDSVCSAIVWIEKQEPIKMKLPKPVVNGNMEIYLGNGISGYVIHKEDKISIFGKGQYSENFDGPQIWAIDYIY